MPKTITISDELWEALQQVKQIISQLAGTQIEKDEEVLEILIKGFVESLLAWPQPGAEQGPAQGGEGGAPGGGSSGIVLE